MGLKYPTPVVDSLRKLLALLDEYQFPADVMSAIAESRATLQGYAERQPRGKKPLSSQIVHDILESPDEAATSLATRLKISRQTVYNVRAKFARKN